MVLVDAVADDPGGAGVRRARLASPDTGLLRAGAGRLPRMVVRIISGVAPSKVITTHKCNTFYPQM